MNGILMMGGVGSIIALVATTLFVAFVLRRVVPTNMVHIVQSGRKTTSYGKGRPAGNVYYEIPSFIPMFGVSVSKFPESIFDVHLRDYEAYDAGRLPFRVDVQAFVRIADSDVAAQKVANFEELSHQLGGILQGAVRRVLATHKLEEILEARSALADAFTKEVDSQLKAWGVETVKTIEFMDIRDSAESKVIANIMAKEKSRIDMESRTTVAANQQAAQEREIEAKRQIDLTAQQAAEVVGQRTAEADKNVGIAKELARQEVLAQAKTTAEREMEVKQVTEVRSAEIARDVAKVTAEQDKTVEIVAAEAERSKTEIIAEGQLLAAQRDAEGIKAKGEAEGKAKEAINMADVTPQLALAKEIGENASYQTYLVSVEQVKAGQAVGVAQADALKAADIKVIVSGGDVPGGMNNITDVFSAKGGQAIGAMLEGLVQTDTGRMLMEKAVKPKAVPRTAPPSAA